MQMTFTGELKNEIYMISFVERACSSSVDFSSMSYKTNNLIELSVFFAIFSAFLLKFFLVRHYKNIVI